jgi:hypothetical protein
MLRECPEGTGRLFAPRDATALAEAVTAMAPAAPSSIARRRARTAQLIGDQSQLAAIFDDVLD